MNPSPELRFQIALDVTTIDEAVALAHCAIAAGADQLEIGKPLIEFVGLTGAAAVIAEFPNIWFELDVMILAGAERYVSAAADLGAKGITVSGLAPTATVDDAIRVGRSLGVRVCVDLFNVNSPVDVALRAADAGAEAAMVHVGVDQRRDNPDFDLLDELREITSRVSIPVAYATYDVRRAIAAVAAGGSEIVVGAPLITDDDPENAMSRFIREVRPRPLEK